MRKKRHVPHPPTSDGQDTVPLRARASPPCVHTMVGTDSGGDGPDVCTARLTCLRELSAGELAGVRHRGRVAPYGKGRTSRDASSRRGGRRSTPCPRARYRTRVSTVGRQRSRGNEGGNWRTEGGRPSSPGGVPLLQGGSGASTDAAIALPCVNKERKSRGWCPPGANRTPAVRLPHLGAPPDDNATRRRRVVARSRAYV
ncbi:hypothetical protein MRX96_015956 [Rhipicephalus microplus]